MNNLKVNKIKFIFKVKLSDNLNMIIYENTIAGFLVDCQAKNHDLLVTRIKANMLHKLGRGVGPLEEQSWRTTLVKISHFFNTLQNQKDQYILLEFNVPTTFKRIDVIVVGSDGIRKNILIIELKGWGKSFYSKIPQTIKINTLYGQNGVSHPNAEAYEYKYLLTEQFSKINQEFNQIEAVSLLPNYQVLENDPLLNAQFKEILQTIKLYHKSNLQEFQEQLYQLFTNGIPRKKIDFLNKLEYHPTLNFQKHLENQFANIRLSTSQERAFNFLVSEISYHLKNPQVKKLITISGMPGSGKTIIAFKILGYIFTKKLMSAKLQLPGPEFRDAFKKTNQKNDFTNMIGGAYSKSHTEVVIIDEAHKAYGQGTSQQFYKELFANQNFVITLIDDKQVINKKGYLKKQVEKVAQENFFDCVSINLEEQFRNGGDALYIDWLNNWIFNEKNYQDFYVNNTYDFIILDDKEFNQTYHLYYERFNVRMASFWTQKWNASFDHLGNAEKLIKVGSSKYIWNPNEFWVKAFHKNNRGSKVPSWFLENVVEKNFNKDKKGPEYIAYFNTIQGSEFDYIFVHLPRLFFLNSQNQLDVDLSQLDMIDMKSQIWTKNNKPNPEKETLNKTYIKNRLMVNLTRGKKGTFIFCEDANLQAWLQKKIISSQNK